MMAKETEIHCIEDVFKLFGSNVAMAGILHVTPSGVSEMKRRRSIPVEYWQPIVDEAQKMDREDLTLERMAVLSAQAAKDKARARETAA